MIAGGDEARAGTTEAADHYGHGGTELNAVERPDRGHSFDDSESGEDA